MDSSGSASPTTAPAGALQVDFGVVRCFGAGDIQTTGLGSGWAAPEEAHNWNDGPEVVLTLSTRRPDFRSVLVIEGAPLVLPEAPRQSITLYANGLRLGYWRLQNPQAIQLEVFIEPDEWRVSGQVATLKLAVHLPDSVRLSDLKADGDGRELGFCFRTIALFPAPHGL